MNRDIRIAIVGAGPAGLSAAMYLEKAGYTNYSILERTDHVGGKCFSPVCNGKRYEMGAVMGVPSDYAVRDAEMFAGIEHDGPVPQSLYRNREGKIIEPFSLMKNSIFAIPRLLAMKAEMKKLKELLATKYKGYDVNGHRGVAKGRYEGYACTEGREKVAGENTNLMDLALPFARFCEVNDIELAKEMMAAVFTGYGYGYFDEIPAAYVLKYLDERTLESLLNHDVHTWKEGTQSLWEGVNAKLQNPARTGCRIEGIKRLDDKVYLRINGEIEEYDRLIVTSPLQFFGEYADLREDERRLFSKIDYERYDSMAVCTKPEEHPDRTCYVYDNLSPERYGHLIAAYSRWKAEKDQPVVAYVLRKHKNRPEIPYDVAKKTVLEDLAVMKNTPATVINEGKWYYFPHIYSEDYVAGWYDEVESMQGKYNTYYAGEIMSFGNMEETVEYSRELVERFFKD